MVADSGFVKPTNKITVQGKAEWIDRTAEEAGIKPGMVLMAGTTQDLCKIYNFTKGAIGFAGFEQASQPNFDTANIYGANRPEGLTGTYASGAKVPVLYLANFVILGMMYAGCAAFKGDRLAAFAGGKLVAGKMTKDGFAVRLPFTKSTSEVSTGFLIPTGVSVVDAFIEVSTINASGTIDVGILSSEVNGDADGFIDGESCAVLGRVQHVDGQTTAANNTLGALLVLGDIKDATATAVYYSVPKRHIGDGVAKTVTYTTSDHTVAGYIYLVLEGLEEVAKSVEDVSAGATVLVEALI